MQKPKDTEFTTKAMVDQLEKQVSASVLIRLAAANNLPGYLNQLMGKRNISTDALAELSALNRASLYKILNGSTRKPKRNVLLRLALTLQIDFQEAQTLLKYGGRAALSGSRGRDIIISDGIINRKTIDDVNQRLQNYRFADLYAKD